LIFSGQESNFEVFINDQLLRVCMKQSKNSINDQF